VRSWGHTGKFIGRRHEMGPLRLDAADFYDGVTNRHECSYALTPKPAPLNEKEWRALQEELTEPEPEPEPPSSLSRPKARPRSEGDTDGTLRQWSQ
jgi:hypothetical protein